IGSLVVDTGVSPPGSPTYAFFVSFQLASSAVSCWALLFSGISGFGFWEDGSPKSMISLYSSSLVVFAVNYFVSISTFKGIMPGTGPSETTLLFVFYFILNPLLLVLWLLSQYFICFFLLFVNWWAIGALTLSFVFFASSQALLYVFSDIVCNKLRHFADGSVFSSLSFMFCIMMVYKYWDIITFDDDEYYRYTEVVPGVGKY
ncbi:DEKNAAC102036, partial [Brettanomyces naardenensis]